MQKTKSAKTVQVGSQQVVVGAEYSALEHGSSFLMLGIKLNMLPLLAVVLDAARAQGATITAAQYYTALYEALLHDKQYSPGARDPKLAQLELQVLHVELQRLREQGVPIPRQEFEVETAAESPAAGGAVTV